MTDLRIARRRSLILDLFESAAGRFIGVDFVKKDGSFRRMTIQPDAVATHEVGCSTPATRQAVITRRQRHPHLHPVFDVNKRAIRSVNLDTVSRVCIDGVNISLEGVL